jgi:hypothetical protein
VGKWASWQKVNRAKGKWGKREMARGKWKGKGMSFREKKMKNNERTTAKVLYLRPIN